MYCFVALAVVCDEYFVPALEVIADNLQLTQDVAGATLMAAGGSAPELFTSLIGTFQESEVGIGTITGSAVFNVLFVIAMCGIFSLDVLELTWWPLARDCSYYSISLAMVAVVFKGTSDGKVEFWEGLVLFIMYLGYIVLMKYNVLLYKFICEKCNIPDTTLSRGGSVMHFNTPGTFRAGILSLLINEKSLYDSIPYKVVTEIQGNLRETFEKFDENKNGNIDKEEFTHLMRDLGLTNKNHNIDSLFTKLDTDSDKQISFEEFKKWYISTEERVEAEMKLIFDNYDYNRDGTITKEALLSLLQEAGVEKEDLKEKRKELHELQKISLKKESTAMNLLQAETIRAEAEEIEQCIEEIYERTSSARSDGEPPVVTFEVFKEW
eukprot:UN25056